MVLYAVLSMLAGTPPLPQTQTCPDGSVILVSETCPWVEDAPVKWTYLRCIVKVPNDEDSYAMIQMEPRGIVVTLRKGRYYGAAYAGNGPAMRGRLTDERGGDPMDFLLDRKPGADGTRSARLGSHDFSCREQG